MLDIDKVTDPDQLRQVARLLLFENQKLHQRIEEMTRRLATLEGTPQARQLELEIDHLREQLATFQKRLFAASSEKRPHATEVAVEKVPQKGHGPQPQPLLPVAEQVHELLADERRCETCGGDPEEMKGQYEESEEITVVERQFVVVTHKRKKYGCRCGAAIVTAPGPLKLVPGGRYSIEFACAVATAKYLDHLPLERQVRMMERQGLVVTSQTLWDQLDPLGSLLREHHERLHAWMLAQPVLGLDETRWRLMEQKKAKQWWVWCLCSPDAVYYRIRGSRAADEARELLGHFSGALVADGYIAYESLARAGPAWRLALCWAHVRRKWVEAEPHYGDVCRDMIDRIGDLYDAERTVPSGTDDDSLRVRAEARTRVSKPIVAKIFSSARELRALPGSTLATARDYLLAREKGLRTFLEEPRVPLDNNMTERGLRGPVVGRKNHYGSRSRRGTEVAAILYTLLETAKLAGVEPAGYLHAAVVAKLRDGRVVLPHEHKAALESAPTL